MTGQRILVCGGRDFRGQAMLFGVLDMEAEQTPIDLIIQGGASGADELARQWAYSRGCKVRAYFADWEAHGKAAGPIRNQEMLDDGRPAKVIAFAGGRGTADMIRRARKAGIEIVEIPK